MHDFVPKLTNLIQLFTEGFPAGDEPELSPVFLLLENPLILAKGQLGRFRDCGLPIQIIVITGRTQGIDVEDILNKLPDLVFDTTQEKKRLRQTLELFA